MKRLFYFIIILVGLSTSAQVGIGVSTANIKASAQLEVASTTKGFLPPRLTGSQRDAINTPAAGLVVWCSNCGTKGELQVYNGTEWVNMIGGTVSAILVPVAIGDTYEGGIVFYILQNGDPGYDATVQHGLIVATSDQSNMCTWSNNYFQTDATGDGIGAGKYNTVKIIANNGGGTYAAQLCADYRGGNYSDWYLPSIYELGLLKLQMDAIGGFSFTNPARFGEPEMIMYNFYWSSTEVTNINATLWGYNYSGSANKMSSVFRARAIRSF